jgi:hypothetical protein
VGAASEVARAGELLGKFSAIGSSQLLTGIGSRSIVLLGHCHGSRGGDDVIKASTSVPFGRMG